MLVCILSRFTLQLPSGISSETILKHSDISEEELLDLIFKLNTDHRVDGLLVQLPLPGIERSMSIQSHGFAQSGCLCHSSTKLPICILSLL